MKLLVTGASGFVGGKFLDRARSSGCEVLGVGRRARPDDPGYRPVDLSRPFDLDFAPDCVVHCAARCSPWGSRREFWLHNVAATRHVVEFCTRRGHPRLIYLSSGSVFYRTGHQLNMTEDSPIGPGFANRYAESKFAGEQVVRSYAGPSLILRPRAVFGPGDTVLFPRILNAARRGRLPLLVNEGPPALADVIAIDTLTEYILRAVQRPGLTGALNLTNNQPVPIVEFLLQVLDRLGMPHPTRRVPVGRAMAAAAFLEAVYGALPFLGEPPITRFGVTVFAWSKTFDVSRALAALGPPAVSIADTLEGFARWYATDRVGASA